MNTEENLWELYLRQHFISQKQTREFIAEVAAKGSTKHNEDIADIIVAKGSEFRKETIVAILNQRDTEVAEILKAGGSFADGIVQMSPRVTGVWESAKQVFDPTKHKKTLDMSVTAAFKAALEKVQVKVMGEKASVATIALITDTATGKTDGTLTIGDDIIIEGDRVKIQDEADSEQGVFIVDASGAEHRVSRRLSVNKPGQLIARIPSDVPAGRVKVIVRTRYSGNKNSVLKTLRVVAYSLDCTAQEA